MSDLSREELIEALTKAGVEVPRKWTKIEMQLRLEQITGQDMAEKVKPKAAKEKSQYQQMVPSSTRLHGAWSSWKRS